MDVRGPTTPLAHRARVLVVGVGSELRSDDAAGRHVAAEVAAELTTGRRDDGRTGAVDAEVEVRSVHQLTPELAAAIAGRRLVVVVDASVEVAAVTVRELDEVAGPGPVSHHLDVGALVRLARVLGDPPARVVTVAVPVRTLELGTGLHPATTADVADAAATVVGLCRSTLRSGLAVSG